MQKFQIKYIHRRHENDYNSEIEYIGGLNSNGTFWKINIEKAIETIIDNTYNFYVIIDNKEFDIILDETKTKLAIKLNSTPSIVLDKIII